MFEMEAWAVVVQKREEGGIVVTLDEDTCIPVAVPRVDACHQHRVGVKEDQDRPPPDLGVLMSCRTPRTSIHYWNVLSCFSSSTANVVDVLHSQQVNVFISMISPF